jgi:hypothetical protein
MELCEKHRAYTKEICGDQSDHGDHELITHDLFDQGVQLGKAVLGVPILIT